MELFNVDRIIEANPEIVSHNMETVRRLTRKVRSQAQFDRSLMVLKYLKDQGIHRTKSGIMLGLGETEEEVIEAMQELVDARVDVLTLGQYLQPTPKHLPVAEFVTPETFDRLKEIGLEMGFKYVESGEGTGIGDVTCLPVTGSGALHTWVTQLFIVMPTLVTSWALRDSLTELQCWPC